MDHKEESKSENLDGASGPVDMDDSLHEMTQSYSEISVDSNDSEKDADSFMFALQKVLNTKSRPKNLEFKSERSVNSNILEYLHKDGTVEHDGDMVMFFSEDLEKKIKLSSPVSMKQENLLSGGDTTSTTCLYRQALEPNLPSLDPTILNCLESDARKVATAVDSLTENLASLLHSISALTVDCLETYRDAVCNTCDAVDSNIKSMYQLMAKCEELSKVMQPTYALAKQIKEIKRLLDLYENVGSS